MSGIVDLSTLERIVNRANWKEIAEFVGIIAIVASLIFVGLQLNQEQEIAEIWQELLGIQRIGIYDNYFELGGDSLLAAQIISRLRDTFQVELDLNRFFETLTIAVLSGSIEKAKNRGSKLQAPAISRISRKSRTRLPKGEEINEELTKS